MSNHWRRVEPADDGRWRWFCECGESGSWMATNADAVRDSFTHNAQSSVPVAPGTDATPDGRGVTSRRDRAGTIDARDLITRLDPAYGPWLIMRDGIAAKRQAAGQVSQRGRHAEKSVRPDQFATMFGQSPYAALDRLGVRR